MEVMERIQKQVDSAAIVLYMKGTPQFPQCGFSATAAKTLASTGGVHYFYCCLSYSYYQQRCFIGY
jgi:glutaredoxin-related protein